MTAPRLAFDAGRGRVVMYVGFPEDGNYSTSGQVYALDDVGGWTEICTSTTPRPSPRYLPAFGYDALHDRLLLVGGATGHPFSVTNASSEVWACTGDTWQLIGDLGQHVIGGQLGDDGDRQLLLGGQDGDDMQFGNKAQQASLDGGMTWSSRDSIPFTTGGYASSVVYDPQQQRLLAIGATTPDLGNYQDRPDELWELDRGGTTWNPVCSPCDRPRASPTLAQADSGETYLLNGYADGTGELAGSWVLDHGAWIQVSNLVPRRDQAGAAFDARRHVLVLYGGHGPSCDADATSDCNDTWELVPNP